MSTGHALASMRAAIITRYYAATFAHGPRVVAIVEGQAETPTVYEYATVPREMHRHACTLALQQFDIAGEWVGGQIDAKTWAWVCVRPLHIPL